MAMDDPRFAFPKAQQYAFLFENAHLLMLSWDRDDAKFLFLIKEHNEQGMTLDYPGKLFTEKVLDTIEHVFFIRLSDEEDGDGERYAMGSYFAYDGRTYGAYYRKEQEPPQVTLFRIEGDPPQQTLNWLEDKEYERVSAAFAQQHEDLLRITQLSSEEGGP